MISTLIIKYLDGNASETETSQVFEWIEASRDNKEVFMDLKKTWALSKVSNSEKTDVWNNLKTAIQFKRTNHRWQFYKYAAILIICVSVGSLFFLNKKQITEKPDGVVLEIQDTNTKLKLDNNSVSKLKQLEGVILSQNDDEIIYNEIITDRPVSYHNLNIPYGKIFKASLADGTVVHLNAGSSLRYPQQFSGNQPRIVFLQGEAFFDVRKDESRPFIVVSDDVTVEVLGTEFNVNTSDYNKEFHCTLVEGSVKLSNKSSAVLLSPGEKGFISGNTELIKVSNVNTKTYTSWTNGELLFEDAKFDDIALKLSKFYNLKFENRNKELKNQSFSGSISLRNSDLESILELLSLDTPFSYEKVGNTIIIDNHEP